MKELIKKADLICMPERYELVSPADEIINEDDLFLLLRFVLPEKNPDEIRDIMIKEQTLSGMMATDPKFDLYVIRHHVKLIPHKIPKGTTIHSFLQNYSKWLPANQFVIVGLVGRLEIFNTKTGKFYSHRHIRLTDKVNMMAYTWDQKKVKKAAPADKEFEQVAMARADEIIKPYQKYADDLTVAHTPTENFRQININPTGSGNDSYFQALCFFTGKSWHDILKVDMECYRTIGRHLYSAVDHRVAAVDWLLSQGYEMVFGTDPGKPWYEYPTLNQVFADHPDFKHGKYIFFGNGLAGAAAFIYNNVMYGDWPRWNIPYYFGFRDRTGTQNDPQKLTETIEKQR